MALADAVKLIWNSKWLVALGTVIPVLAALAIAWLMTPVYRAEVVMVAASNEDSGGLLSGLSGELGGLAAVAGISLPQSKGSKEAFGTLRSQALVRHFIEQNDLLPTLYEGRWDEARKAWKPSFWRKTPDLWLGSKKFMERVRSVSEDTKMGLITMTVEWKRPELAAQWANGLINLANDELRSRAIMEAEGNIAFLSEQLEKTTTVELRNSIHRLMEQQIKSAMLARGRKEFAFRVVDPAVPAREPIRPRPVIMATIAAFLGMLVSSFLAVRLGYVRGRSREAWVHPAPSSSQG